ncbi:MAG: hypothetical protein H0V17_16965 [Deltaproteobacteria bacterium]|nr:hypothetical protein [Deltaproteobacteria bacterium]
MIAGQLIQRRRLAAKAQPQPFDQEPIDAILVVEDFTDLGEIYDLNEMPGGIPAQAVAAYDDRAQAHGETWTEALQEQAIELGPELEHVLVFLDETELELDVDPTDDRPIADLGSGGPRGA